MLKPWTVHVGDCRHTLAAMPEESIDAVVTDTPYGLSTLLDPPNLDREALWKKLMAHNRNRRPLRAYVGDALDAFLAREARSPNREEFLDIVDAAERQRIIEGPAIERLFKAWLDTGENPVMKGRGFMGKEWDALVPPPNTWRAVWRVMKPGAYAFAFGGTRTADLISMSLRFADFEIEDTFSWLYGSGMPKRVRLDLKIDEHFGMKDARPVTGSKLGLPGYHLNPHDGGATYGSGMGNTTAEQRLKSSQISGAATPEAARFVGWDRASKPGWEPIIIAVKPLRGTIAETALRYGTGGMNADGCRIPRGYGAGLGDGTGENIAIDARGGFPANVIIDEEVAAELDRQSGISPAKAERIGRRGGRGFGMFDDEKSANHNGVWLGMEAGGASRFFYTAKASTSERDKGLENLPVLTPGERSGGREEGSAAGRGGEKGRNPHPTVKPISLMQYLVRRACPPGAWDPDVAKRPVVLDCFMGSGSTGVACMVEGVRFVGCELEAASAEVARLRLQHAYALPREEGEAPPATRDGGQGKLF